MKVLLVNTTDATGGADRAVLRLHRSLKSIDIDSRVRVLRKSSNLHDVYGPITQAGQFIALFSHTLDQLRLLTYKKKRNKQIFSSAWLPSKSISVPDYHPEIVHLHWISSGYLSVTGLSQIGKPLVWTMHDMWPFTGGCHYSGGCLKFQTYCHSCPVLGSNRKSDLSNSIWRRKMKAWRNLDLHIVSPSKWLADLAGSSTVFKDKPIHVIPNSIDTNVFRRLDKTAARQLLGIDQDKKIILFGAASATSDSRKGFHLLRDALNDLKQKQKAGNLLLVVFGASEPKDAPPFDIPTKYLGNLVDDISLITIYSAADLFLLPSLEDNLPNTIMESMACGLPSVAHAVGGVAEMVDHMETGYLSKLNSSEDLSFGISWVLEDQQRWDMLSNNAAQKARKFYTSQVIAEKHLSLYESILRQ